jgi:hypothetical protein
VQTDNEKKQIRKTASGILPPFLFVPLAHDTLIQQRQLSAALQQAGKKRSAFTINHSAIWPSAHVEQTRFFCFTHSYYT